MTQVLKARIGKVTAEMEMVAEREGLGAKQIMADIASGKVVIPKNKLRKPEIICGIGKGLRIKVSALIGTSSDRDFIEMEQKKLAVAEAAGCDAVMDLSTGGDIDEMRKQTLQRASVPVGSVPIYQAAIEAVKKRGAIVGMTEDDMFEAVERHAAEGVDFMAVHCALNFDVIKRLVNTGRVADVVSRGGAFLTGWMLHNKKENPLYEKFDRLLSILKAYDVTLSIGDAVRPGAIADSLDGAQLQGLVVTGELVARAQAAGIQVIVEGPGHVPLHHVEAMVLLQKRLCNDAPYFILGTLATDVAPGYDHIASAIGGTMAGAAGADFICCVTPAEHLGLPSEEDVKEGVIAARISAHAADLARGNQKAWERDIRMGYARAVRDLDRQVYLSIDPVKSGMAVNSSRKRENHCAACGSECAARIAAVYFGLD